MAKPHLYPTIPSLTLETQLYTQRRSNSESPDNYRFTVQELLDYLVDQGVVVNAGGPYTSDADAAANGVAVGEYYEVAQANTIGIPAANGGI